MNHTQTIYVKSIRDAYDDGQNIWRRSTMKTMLAVITALETELATERVAAETNGMKVFELGKRIATLETALRQIANGDGYYGAQAKEYKDIARAALGE